MRLVWGVGRNKVKPKHGAEQDALENEVTKLSLLFLTLGDIYLPFCAQDQLEAEVEEDIEVDIGQTINIAKPMNLICRWLMWKKKVKKRILPQSQSQRCRTSQLFWRVRSIWYVAKL